MTSPTGSEPRLKDACECGHTFATHCTPEFPNGGYCAASDIGTHFDGCACSAFSPKPRVTSPTEPARPNEKRGDVVYTPDWCAKDMVDHFQPTGVVLDPCVGKGAFLNLLPAGSPSCEITAGSDFFEWEQPVDWVIGNPPYSLTRPWFRHSYDIAAHLCYLVPLRNVFSGYGFLREIHDFGGIREIRIYGTGGKLGFPMGNAVGAFHIQRRYGGATRLSFYDDDVRARDLFQTANAESA